MPASSTPQADLLRADLATLTAFAGDDLAAIWRSVSGEDDAKQAFNDLLPPLLDEYGSAAQAAAADWYDEARSAAEVRGSFQAIISDLPADFGTSQLIAWAYAESKGGESVRALLEGGVQRRIVDQSRSTLITSSLVDKQTVGWQRVGDGACKFCQMLIGRGAIYREGSARFGSHDNCNCSVVPVFGGEPIPVKPYTVSPRRDIDPKTGKPIIDRDFLRAKKWIADNL